MPDDTLETRSTVTYILRSVCTFPSSSLLRRIRALHLSRAELLGTRLLDFLRRLLRCIATLALAKIAMKCRKLLSIDVAVPVLVEERERLLDLIKKQDGKVNEAMVTFEHVQRELAFARERTQSPFPQEFSEVDHCQVLANLMCNGWPLELLDGFKGYLQTDGYAGYNAACEKYSLIHVGCMDHARRKFIEAQDAQPKGKKVKVSKADTALGYINTLYRIERKLTELKETEEYTPEQVVKYRYEHSIPVLEKLKGFLDKTINRVPSDSLTGKAVNYMLNQWSKLVAYCDNGELRISNIMAENAIRPFAVGRRAWLFADTPSGAQASATCYSLIETVKLNGLEPYSYLHTLLSKLPYAETLEDIEALLPWNLTKA